MDRFENFKSFAITKKKFSHSLDSEKKWREIISKVSDKTLRDLGNSILDTIVHKQGGKMSEKQKAILSRIEKIRFPNRNFFQSEILKDLSLARKSIKVAVSWLIDKALIEELIVAAKRGVNVKVIVSCDELNLIREKSYWELINAGGLVKKIGSKKSEEGNFMHCKFFIVDDKIAKAGSYNWTLNGSVNFETLDAVPVKEKVIFFEKMYRDAENFFEK